MKVTVYGVLEDGFLTADFEELRHYYQSNAEELDAGNLVFDNIDADEILELILAYADADIKKVNQMLDNMVYAIQKDRDGEFEHWRRNYVVEQEIDIPVTISADINQPIIKQPKTPF